METLIPWIIAVAVLAAVVIFGFLLRDRLVYFGEYIKNLFR